MITQLHSMYVHTYNYNQHMKPDFSTSNNFGAELNSQDFGVATQRLKLWV